MLHKNWGLLQDYVRLHGLQTWQEEFTRIIDYNAEQVEHGTMRNVAHEKHSRLGIADDFLYALICDFVKWRNCRNAIRSCVEKCAIGKVRIKRQLYRSRIIQLLTMTSQSQSRSTSWVDFQTTSNSVTSAIRTVSVKRR